MNISRKTFRRSILLKIIKAYNIHKRNEQNQTQQFRDRSPVHLIEDCLHETDTYKDILPDVSMLPTNSIPDEKLPINSGKFDIFPFNVDIDASNDTYLPGFVVHEKERRPESNLQRLEDLTSPKQPSLAVLANAKSLAPLVANITVTDESVKRVFLEVLSNTNTLLPGICMNYFMVI